MLSKHLLQITNHNNKLIFIFKLLPILLKRSEQNIQCYFHEWNVRLHFLYELYRSKLHCIYSYDIGDKLYITMKHLDDFTYLILFMVKHKNSYANGVLIAFRQITWSHHLNEFRPIDDSIIIQISLKLEYPKLIFNLVLILSDHFTFNSNQSIFDSPGFQKGHCELNIYIIFVESFHSQFQIYYENFSFIISDITHLISIQFAIHKKTICSNSKLVSLS